MLASLGSASLAYQYAIGFPEAAFWGGAALLVPAAGGDPRLAPLRAAVGPADGVFKFQVQQLVPDVYVARRPDVFRQPVEGNMTLIVNQADVVVVDARGTIASAESALGLLRSLTDKPVRCLVNTHWHGDHNLGNKVWRDAFPGLEIIAHARDAVGRGWLFGYSRREDRWSRRRRSS